MTRKMQWYKFTPCTTNKQHTVHYRCFEEDENERGYMGSSDFMVSKIDFPPAVFLVDIRDTEAMHNKMRYNADMIQKFLSENELLAEALTREYAKTPDKIHISI